MTSGTEGSLVLDRALGCLASGVAAPLTGPTTAGLSERCVEVPWVAASLQDPGRLLDVGWVMSPPEWLGVLLAARARGAELTGIDIIDAERVSTRYPVEWLERILDVPVRIESVLDAMPTSGLYDTITCVSTLEHIGFDVAAPPDDTTTAYVRARNPTEAVSWRDPTTDLAFLNAAHRLIRPGGSLLISVPAGIGVPILHQDSLGLFTHQCEYDETSWNAITGDERFKLIDEAYFRHEDAAGWFQVSRFDQLTDQTSALRPFATGCAMVHLIRK